MIANKLTSLLDQLNTILTEVEAKFVERFNVTVSIDRTNTNGQPFTLLFGKRQGKFGLFIDDVSLTRSAMELRIISALALGDLWDKALLEVSEKQ